MRRVVAPFAAALLLAAMMPVTARGIVGPSVIQNGGAAGTGVVVPASVADPGAPQNVAATTPGYESVTITWDPPLDTSGRGLYGYSVYWGTTLDALTEGTFVGPTVGTWLFKPSFIVPGTTYYFVVAAEYDTLEWARSAPVSAVPVARPSPTVTLASAPAPSEIDSSATFTATVAPAPGGGSVMIYDEDGLGRCGGAVDASTGVATCTVYFRAAGTYTLTAKFGGYGDWGPAASDPLTHTVIISTYGWVYPTSSSPGPVTLTGEVRPNPAGGTITFSHPDGTAFEGCVDLPLDSASRATCNVTFSTVGTYTVRLDYSGFGDYQPSQRSTDVKVTSATTTELVQSAASTAAGEPVTYTATVKAADGATPPGTVTFADWGAQAVIPDCVQLALDDAGSASCTTTYAEAGSHEVMAFYGETGYYLTSYNAVTHVVTPALTATTTALSASAATAIVGQEVTYTASVSPDPSGGSVVFLEDGAAIPGCEAVVIGGADAGIATCNRTYEAVGTHAITARFEPTAPLPYGPSTSAALSEQVTYGVKVLTQGQSVPAGSKLTVGVQLVDFAGANVSSSSVVLTLAGVRPPWGTVEGAFTFVPASGKKAASYTYTLPVPTSATARAYRLAFTATGDPVTHDDIAFTVTSKKK